MLKGSDTELMHWTSIYMSKDEKQKRNRHRTDRKADKHFHNVLQQHRSDVVYNNIITTSALFKHRVDRMLAKRSRIGFGLVDVDESTKRFLAVHIVQLLHYIF